MYELKNAVKVPVMFASYWEQTNNRGKRYGETFHETREEAIAETTRKILSYKEDFAFVFGDVDGFPSDENEIRNVFFEYAALIIEGTSFFVLEILESEMS